ncbi:NUDIX domain-containing protein [Streptomyces sp. NPDC048567]|uniref:NUDIX domain-containing protein n=1 Tax=Streptomyces sp. NPDC048567 TaxID=3365570 RepID=UPI003723A366
MTQRQGQARSDHGTQIADRPDTPHDDGPLAPSSFGREPAILIAVGEPLTRRFLRFTGQKSANPPASPGGKAEPGEALDEAAARELKEESGLLVDPVGLALVHVIHIEQGRDQAGQFVLFVFATDTWAGELTNAEPDKHLTAQCVPADRLPQPAFPTSAQALAAYRNGGPVFSRYGWSVTAAQ